MAKFSRQRGSNLAWGTISVTPVLYVMEWMRQNTNQIRSQPILAYLYFFRFGHDHVCLCDGTVLSRTELFLTSIEQNVKSQSEIRVKSYDNKRYQDFGTKHILVQTVHINST